MSLGPCAADYDDEGYQRHVCIEAAAVTTPVKLAAGRTWSGTQTLTAC